MQLSMKCSIAVHCLIFIHEAKGIARVTSPLLAESTGCNPVIIRNVISSLKKAGIITVARGTGGAELCMDPSEITLFMIYNALEPKGLSSLIGIHPCSEPCGAEYPERPCCAVSKNRTFHQKHDGKHYVKIYDSGFSL